jgi:hypothetical protein
MATATQRKITGQVRTAKGKFRAGQEEEFSKVATKEEVAHLTRMGAITGFDTNVKDTEVSKNLGPTAATATKADTGALRKGGQNDEALVALSPVSGPANAPATTEGEGGEDLKLEDMSRKQLLAKAEAAQIDMTTVEGTGKDGYVTMEDLIRAIEAKQAEAPPA